MTPVESYWTTTPCLEEARTAKQPPAAKLAESLATRMPAFAHSWELPLRLEIFTDTSKSPVISPRQAATYSLSPNQTSLPLELTVNWPGFVAMLTSPVFASLSLSWGFQTGLRAAALKSSSKEDLGQAPPTLLTCDQLAVLLTSSPPFSKAVEGFQKKVCACAAAARTSANGIARDRGARWKLPKTT